nr:hypothetical protein [Tanacetum cinerariifolium]
MSLSMTQILILIMKHPTSSTNLDSTNTRHTHELAEYINTLSWNRPAFYNNGEDDDEDYTIVITPDFSITDYLSMGDEHLSTILKIESDELRKSSVENLVPNPNLDSTSKNDRFDTESYLLESLLNRDTLMASSPKIDSLLDEFAGELIFLKSISPGIDEADCDPEKEIRLIDKLLYDNSSPRPPQEFNSDVIIEYFSPSPILVEDCDPFMEQINLFLAFDGSIPSGIDSDHSDSEGDNLFLERLLHDDPVPLPDTLDFLNVVRVFLPFFTYLVNSLILLSSGSEDTIFNPGISNYHFSSLEPGVSHQSRTFMKFNVYLNHLNESPMEILSSTCFPMDQ